jgi:hypothetical protein
MAVYSLTQRYDLVKRKSSGSDPLADAVLAGEQPLADLYEKAKAIYQSPIKKTYVESCLVASPDMEKISAILEIPVEVLVVYKDFFFAFPSYDKLTLLELVSKASTAEEKGMKMWALSQGLDFISWRLGRQVNVSPITGLQDLFTTSLYKSKEALFSGNSSDNSREATKWTKLSMDLARLLKLWVMDSNEARSDLQMALASLNPDFKGYDQVLPGEDDDDDELPSLGEDSSSGTDVSVDDMSLGSIDDLLDIPGLPKN